MSIQDYARIQSQSEQDTQSIGMVLPKLQSATLVLDSKRMSTDEMRNHIIQFSANEGWIMARDELLITTIAPDDDIIEAEFCNDQASLAVKLIADNLYLVTTYQCKEETSSNMLYQTQPLVLQTRLLKFGVNTALYRFWWQQGSTTDNNYGRWVPLAQQFIGFDYDKEIK